MYPPKAGKQYARLPQPEGVNAIRLAIWCITGELAQWSSETFVWGCTPRALEAHGPLVRPLLSRLQDLAPNGPYADFAARVWQTLGKEHPETFKNSRDRVYEMATGYAAVVEEGNGYGPAETWLQQAYKKRLVAPYLDAVCQACERELFCNNIDPEEEYDPP